MSETNSVEPVESESEQQGEPAKPLGENGEKALQSERAARRAAEKQSAALQSQLDEINAASLSELERTQKERDDAATEAAAARSELLRAQVARKHGITDDEDVELFLTGTDEETLTKQAARLAERLTSSQTSVGAYVPNEGHSPSVTALNGDGLEQALRNKLGI